MAVSFSGNRNASALFEAAEKLFQKGDYQKAYDKFSQVTQVDGGAHQAYGRLSQILTMAGHGMDALECITIAMNLAPEDTGYKRRFLAVTRYMAAGLPNPDMRRLLLACLTDDDLDFSHTGGFWHSLLRHEADFQKAETKERLTAADLKTLQGNEFFIGGLRRVLVFKTEFEDFIARLRAALLENPDPEFTPLARALADYCILSEYIIPVASGELEKLESLKAQEGEITRLIALCYEGGLAAETLKDIPRLTPIDDEISRKVKAQYEVFPYPRWKTFSADIKDRETEGRLSGKKAAILVAGCGTGNEAIELAAAFPDSHVTAVDLSAASLSYAINKAREFSIANVEFMQGDILKLGGIGRQFDFIASSGVLHHMDDPMAGWRVITGLLKPGGLMRIALYSRRARWAINEARALIAEQGIGGDEASIRYFRSIAPAEMSAQGYKSIASVRDYYFMAECRDLLFHVQEHQFEIPQVKAALQELGLEFVKFFLDAQVIYDFQLKNSAKGALQNLDLWHKFEEERPDTFIHMYRFWCRKS